jgi:pimeloyl-ACP methyl ester carboxylesterase
MFHWNIRWNRKLMDHVNNAEPAAEAARHYPLAALNGARPEAPAWVSAALAQQPERGSVEVQGAAIAYFAWGDAQAPGILLVHGGRAHAGWWDFIAPLLAEDYRVVAMSLSGMGHSGWRAAYTLPLYADEITSVARASGLLAGGRSPMLVGHSFGGLPLIELIARAETLWRGAVLLDTHITHPSEDFYQRNLELRVSPQARSYASEAAALARFRLIPPHRIENLALIDHVGRGGLRHGGGEAGWSWSFDPAIDSKLEINRDLPETLRRRRCPVALVWGEHSELFQPDFAVWMRDIVGQDAPAISIPEAGHHVMIDQPLALVSALRALFSVWPG